MPDYDNSMSGAIFRNLKEGNDKRPDYKGSCELQNGVECWISAWIKTSRKGEKFMSLSFELKEGHSFGAAPATSDIPASNADFAPGTPAAVFADEDIPFLWDGPVFDTDQVKTHSNR